MVARRIVNAALPSGQIEVELEEVSKRFEEGEGAALKKVSLAVGKGELVVVVGPSGCGKSTTLRIVAGLEEADSGGIRIGGKSMMLANGCRRDARDDRGRVRLRLWYTLGGRNREVRLEIIRRFHAAQDDVRVEAVYQGDYFESLAKLRTAIAAKAAPALSHVVAEVLPYLARAGALEALDGHPGMSEIPFVRAISQAGAFRFPAERRVPLFGVPLNRSTPLMYCNGELFDKHGLRPPETWDDMRRMARVLSQPGQRWGHEVPIAWWFWVALVGQAGGSVFDDSGRPTLGGEAGVRALRLWQDLIHRDRVMRPPPGRDYDAWNATNQDFLGGRAAFIWTSTEYIRYLEDNAKFPLSPRASHETCARRFPPAEPSSSS
jgi:sn-glycerol 3-phosphate transport system substrate-binding protein